MQTQQPCSRCGGKGKLVKNPCKVCHGSGKAATKKTLEVSIPMGIDDDQSMRTARSWATPVPTAAPPAM